MTDINQLQTFNFNQTQVRVQIINNTEYFCAKDVTDALKYSNGRDAVARHCKKDGVVKHDIGVITGTKSDGSKAVQQIETTFISESNVLRLIVNSKLPCAEKFEAWVFEEILPQIRKTGRYNISEPLPQINANFMKQIAETMAKQESELKQKDEVIKEQSKSVILYNQLANADGLFNLQDAGKALHLYPNKFIERLETKRYFKIRTNKKKPLIPKQQYIDTGYFELKTYTTTVGYESKQRQQAFITGKGLEYFRKKIHTEFYDIMNKPDKARYGNAIEAYNQPNITQTI